MIVVSDTSPILNLDRITKLELLRDLYGEVMIPQAVYDELAFGGFDFNTVPWLRSKSANNKALVREVQTLIEKGEAEAIVLAQEVGAHLLLIDERIGRQVARENGLKITGLLGVLRLAKSRSLILSVRPILDDLVATARFWVDSQLYREFLESVDEV